MGKEEWDFLHFSSDTRPPHLSLSPPFFFQARSFETLQKRKEEVFEIFSLLLCLTYLDLENIFNIKIVSSPRICHLLLLLLLLLLRRRRRRRRLGGPGHRGRGLPLGGRVLQVGVAAAVAAAVAAVVTAGLRTRKRGE